MGRLAGEQRLREWWRPTLGARVSTRTGKCARPTMAHSAVSQNSSSPDLLGGRVGFLDTSLPGVGGPFLVTTVGFPQAGHWPRTSSSPHLLQSGIGRSACSSTRPPGVLGFFAGGNGGAAAGRPWVACGGFAGVGEGAFTGAKGLDTAAAGGAVGRPDFAGGGGGLAPFGRVDGNRTTSEISAEAAAAGVAFFTTMGGAVGFVGRAIRSVFAVAGSSTAFPAGVELPVGRNTDATALGFSFSLSLEPRTLTG